MVVTVAIECVFKTWPSPGKQVNRYSFSHQTTTTSTYLYLSSKNIHEADLSLQTTPFDAFRLTNQPTPDLDTIHHGARKLWLCILLLFVLQLLFLLCKSINHLKEEEINRRLAERPSSLGRKYANRDISNRAIEQLLQCWHY